MSTPRPWKRRSTSLPSISSGSSDARSSARSPRQRVSPTSPPGEWRHGSRSGRGGSSSAPRRHREPGHPSGPSPQPQPSSAGRLHAASRRATSSLSTARRPSAFRSIRLTSLAERSSFRATVPSDAAVLATLVKGGVRLSAPLESRLLPFAQSESGFRVHRDLSSSSTGSVCRPPTLTLAFRAKRKRAELTPPLYA